MKSVDDLIEYGFPLIRLQPGSKKPLGKEWTRFHNGDMDLFRRHELNAGVLCGEKIGDYYVHVLDIDNKGEGKPNGFEKLRELQEKHGELPSTLRVATPHNGGHFYFKSSVALKSKVIEPGIEFRGARTYAVAPFSKVDGKIYEVIEDEEIAPIPEWLEKKLEAEVQRTYFNTEDYALIKNDVVHNQDNELMREAGKLRHNGYGQEDIFAMLKTRFERSYAKYQDSSDPYTDKDFARIARQVCKYPPGERPLETVELSPSEDIKIVEKPDDKIKVLLIESFNEAQGLLREIAQTVMDHAARPYEHWSLASAISVISSAAQGSYRIPNLNNPNVAGDYLCSYNWLHGPSACGKEAYRSAVQTYVSAVSDHLICPQLGSSYGLRAAIYAFNSRILIMDEMQDEMNRFAGKNASSYLQQVLTDMKLLANGVSELPAIAIKSNYYPALYSPRFSIFGVGTREGFIKHLSTQMIGGGLLSRFTVWPSFEIASRQFSSNLERAPEAHVDALKEIFVHGLRTNLEYYDAGFALTEYQSLGERGKHSIAKHEAQTDAQAILGIEDSARLVLMDFYNSQQELFRKYAAENLSESDTSPGSIVDRAPRMAMNFSAVHALGCGRKTIMVSDALWATKLAKTLTDSLAETVLSFSGEDAFDRECNTLMKRIRQHFGIAPFNISSLRTHASSRLTRPGEIELRLHSLLVRKKIVALDKDGLPCEIAAATGSRGAIQFPYGARFRIR